MMIAPEIKKLQTFVGLDAKQGRENIQAFFWNIALEKEDLPGWILRSQQFVQFGESKQLATAVWQGHSSGEQIKTDVETYSDGDAAQEAFVRRLASLQIATLQRCEVNLSHKGLPKGSVFQSKKGNVLIAALGNLVVVLTRMESGSSKLIELGEQLLASLREPVQEEDVVKTPNRSRAKRQRKTINQVQPYFFLGEMNTSRTAEAPRHKNIDSILRPPDDANQDWPVTRDDRPERIVAYTNNGDLTYRYGNLGIARCRSGDTVINVVLKQHGHISEKQKCQYTVASED